MSRETSITYSSEGQVEDAYLYEIAKHSLLKNPFNSSDTGESAELVDAPLSLMDDIVAVTEAELDLRLTSYHRLIGIVEERLIFISP